MPGPYMVAEPTKEKIERLIGERGADSSGGPWAVRQLASSGVSLTGTTSGTFTANAGSTQTQPLFAGLDAGAYLLIGTFRCSTPLAPSVQQSVFTDASGTVTPTPTQYHSPIPATGGSWTTQSVTLCSYYVIVSPGSSITLIGNSGNTAAQNIGYAYNVALLKLS